MLQAGEWNTTAEGTQEKFWAHRRNKVLLLERARGGGADRHRNLPVCSSVSMLSEGEAPLGQATGSNKPLAQPTGDRVLLVQAAGVWEPLVWAKGIRGLSVTWCLSHDLQAVGTDCGGSLRGQREAWPATTGGLGAGSTCSPSQLRGQQKKKKKKKEGTATKHHTLLLSPHWKYTCPAAVTAKCSGQHPDA